MPAISASYLEEIDRRYCAWKGLSKPPAPLAGLRGSFSFTISEAAWYIRQHGQRNKVSGIYQNSLLAVCMGVAAVVPSILPCNQRPKQSPVYYQVSQVDNALPLERRVKTWVRATMHVVSLPACSSQLAELLQLGIMMGHFHGQLGLWLLQCSSY